MNEERFKSFLQSSVTFSKCYFYISLHCNHLANAVLAMHSMCRMLCIVQALRLLLHVLVCHHNTSVVVSHVIQICHVISEHHDTTSLHNTAAAALLSLCCSTDLEACLTVGRMSDESQLVPHSSL